MLWSWASAGTAKRQKPSATANSVHISAAHTVYGQVSCTTRYLCPVGSAGGDVWLRLLSRLIQREGDIGRALGPLAVQCAAGADHHILLAVRHIGDGRGVA